MKSKIILKRNGS